MDGEHVGGPVPVPVGVRRRRAEHQSGQQRRCYDNHPCAHVAAKGTRRLTHRGPAQRPAPECSSHGGGLPAAAEAWGLLRLLLLLLLLRGLRSSRAARRA